MQVYGQPFPIPEITYSVRTVVNSSNTTPVPEFFTQQQLLR